jgi:hypothetical protein
MGSFGNFAFLTRKRGFYSHTELYGPFLAHLNKWVRLVILRFSCFIADFAEPQSKKNRPSIFALAATRRVNEKTLLDLTFRTLFMPVAACTINVL